MARLAPASGGCADAAALFDLDPQVQVSVLGHNTVDHAPLMRGRFTLALAMTQLKDAATANQTAALLALHTALLPLVSALEAAQTAVH